MHACRLLPQVRCYWTAIHFQINLQAATLPPSNVLFVSLLAAQPQAPSGGINCKCTSVNASSTTVSKLLTLAAAVQLPATSGISGAALPPSVAAKRAHALSPPRTSSRMQVGGPNVQRAAAWLHLNACHACAIIAVDAIQVWTSCLLHPAHFDVLFAARMFADHTKVSHIVTMHSHGAACIGAARSPSTPRPCTGWHAAAQPWCSLHRQP